MSFFSKFGLGSGKDRPLDQATAGSSQHNEPPPAYSDIFSSSNYDYGTASPPEYSLASANAYLYMKQESSSLMEDLLVKMASQREEERCSTCFDPIVPDKAEGFSGEMVQMGPHKVYHYECYLRSKGPRCAHCSFPLIANPDKGLSGRWGIYDQKKYHEECYKYAGPRCSSCFDVIVEDTEQGQSGRWRQDENGKLFHEECFMKKLYAEARAK